MSKLIVYKDPPTKGDWAMEYVVLEFWSGAQNPSDFKCVVCTTYSLKLAEEVVEENKHYRTWVKAFRLFPSNDQTFIMQQGEK